MYLDLDVPRTEKQESKKESLASLQARMVSLWPKNTDVRGASFEVAVDLANSHMATGSEGEMDSADP